MIRLKAKHYILTVITCILLCSGIAYYYFFTTMAENTETAYIYIDADDNQDSVFTKLKSLSSNHGLNGFKTIVRHSKYAENIHTGRYAIKPGENAYDIFNRLKSGQQSSMNLRIPSFRTMDKLAGHLGRKLMIDSLTLVKAFYDTAFCKKYGYSVETLPALFVPNTYDMFWNVSLENLMKRMTKEHQAFWNKERTAKADSLKLSKTEVATLASIIDEETANNGEKPMIAGMYLNRLRINMPLQADPTIKFAMKEFKIRRIYNNMLKTESPYNTYINTGLPPGPIKIASIAGIDAVLNYVDHKYLYMCAKEDFSGTHNFAATYREHLNNAIRYRKALNKRNIK